MSVSYGSLHWNIESPFEYIEAISITRNVFSTKYKVNVSVRSVKMKKKNNNNNCIMFGWLSENAYYIFIMYRQMFSDVATFFYMCLVLFPLVLGHDVKLKGIRLVLVFM